MSTTNYYSAQEILRRCFDNNTGKLSSSSTAYTAQDYLNAIYDETNDCLRVSLSGYTPSGGDNGYWLTPITSVDNLPTTATNGSMIPVIDSTKNVVFYYRSEGEWVNLYTNNALYRSFIEWGIANQTDLSFLVANKDLINNMTGSSFKINETKITFDTAQNVDTTNADGDIETSYVMNVNGYVLSVETYANNDAIVADRQLVKTIYNPDTGVSSVYFTSEEYEYYAALTSPKNVAEIYYISNSTTNSVLNIRQLEGVDFTPKHNIVYNYTITGDTEINFDVSYLRPGEQIEFELDLTQPSMAANVTFPTNFVWSSLSQSNVNQGGKTYCIIIRYKNSKFYGKIDAIYE